MKWKEIKRMVLERDKKCRSCGSVEKLTVDHVIPLSRGGTDEPGNLRTLCASCNQNKSSFIEWDFLRRLRLAMYADELVLKVKGDLKGAISSVENRLGQQIKDVKSWCGNYLDEKSKKQEERIALLERKIAALETFHSIQFVKEVEVFEGYKKNKKKKTKD